MTLPNTSDASGPAGAKLAAMPRLRRHFSARPWFPYVFLAAGWTLSLAAAWLIASRDQATARTAFNVEAQDVRREIQSGLNAYVEVVRAGTALLAASNEINMAEFRAFVAGLALPERYPGLQGIGFAQHVRRGDLRSLVAAVRLDGVTRFRVWPSSRQPEHQPVILFEPQRPGDPLVVGFDMATDPILNEALNLARDTGEPAASMTLSDVRRFHDHGPADVVVFIPVYRVKAPTQTIEQRRRAFIGAVFSPFDVAAVVRRVMIGNSPPVVFDIRDTVEGRPTALIYQSRNPGSSRFSSTDRLQIAGREWHMTIRSSAPPLRIASPATVRTFSVGLLLSLLLYLITRGQVRAWSAAARHESDLRAAAQALRDHEAELHRTIEREREARLQVEAADRAKDEFLATLSHELRTPLNAILGWSRLLRTESVSARAIDSIERNARVQAQLIDDLLDVSRIVSGTFQVQFEAVDLPYVIRSAIDAVRPAAVAKQIDLVVMLDPLAGAAVMGDARRLQQVVWNLLSNAVKFTPGRGRVEVTLTALDLQAEITVRDTGPGIPPTFLPHVFSRFRQADATTTRQHGGLGIGLAIVKHVTEAHGGTVSARSNEDEGATFTIRLPLNLVRRPGGSLQAQAAAAHSNLDGVRVLLVEDGPDARELLARGLSACGAEVTAVGSANEALQAYGQQPFDLLVADIGMPTMDGNDLIRTIRMIEREDKRKRLPAVAVTAYAGIGDRETALAAGFDWHIAKPVEPEVVAGVLEKVLSRV